MVLMIDFKKKSESKDDIIVHKGKCDPYQQSKALINPFDPSHVTIKLNSNRRRWTHVFPQGPTGIFMQQHHYQAVPQNTMCTMLPYAFSFDPKQYKTTKITFSDQVDGLNQENKLNQMRPSLASKSSLETNSFKKGISSSYDLDWYFKQKNSSQDNKLWAWGATGEQEWTPAITTGVDWKSLVMPACLPITTDFLPDKRTLQQDYVTYGYDLLPDEQDFSRSDDKKIKFSSEKVYWELLYQRLQQGFQIILLSRTNEPLVMNDKSEQGQLVHILSIGRIYHELLLKDGKITITYYHPRHPYTTNNIQYCYRIRTPDNETYGVSWVDFTSEKLEAYKWNYLDNFIVFRGDSDYQLIETLKFWRFRLLVLPSMQTITKTIIDNVMINDDFRCDLYQSFTYDEKISLQNGFLKLIEAINRIKRPNVIKQASTRSDHHSGKHNTNRRHSSQIVDTAKINEMATLQTEQTQEQFSEMSLTQLLSFFKNAKYV